MEWRNREKMGTHTGRNKEMKRRNREEGGGGEYDSWKDRGQK